MEKLEITYFLYKIFFSSAWCNEMHFSLSQLTSFISLKPNAIGRSAQPWSTLDCIIRVDPFIWEVPYFVTKLYQDNSSYNGNIWLWTFCKYCLSVYARSYSFNNKSHASMHCSSTSYSKVKIDSVWALNFDIFTYLLSKHREHFFSYSFVNYFLDKVKFVYA